MYIQRLGLILKTNYHRLINLVKYQALDPLEYYIDDKRKIIYVENAKVACTSIKLAMFEPDIENAMDIHEKLREKAVYSVPPSKSGYYTFTVIRDPVRRFISCYKDKVLRKGDENTELSIFDLKFYKVIFRIFSGERYHGSKTDIVTFAKIVSSIPDSLSDRHFRSQYYMKAKSSQNIEFIKLEDLSAFWGKMMEVYDLPALRKENSTKINFSISNIELNALSMILNEKYEHDYESLELR